MKNHPGKIIIFLILGVFIMSTGFVIAQENTDQPDEQLAADNPEIQALNQDVREMRKSQDEMLKVLYEIKAKVK